MKSWVVLSTDDDEEFNFLNYTKRMHCCGFIIPFPGLSSAPYITKKIKENSTCLLLIQSMQIKFTSKAARWGRVWKYSFLHPIGISIFDAYLDYFAAECCPEFVRNPFCWQQQPPPKSRAKTQLVLSI